MYGHPAGTSYTDGGGVFSYTTTVGTYYKFVVNNVPGTQSGEGEVIWQSNTGFHYCSDFYYKCINSI